MKVWYDSEFLEDGRTIDLISIGMVAEDGREYYAVSLDADWERIHKDPWLVENVVSSLPEDKTDPVYKHREQIAREVQEFLSFDKKPELWAWYSAYDHVALAQLFGKMIFLPEPIPMYTHDLRAVISTGTAMSLPKQPDGLHNALEDARHLKRRFEFVEAKFGKIQKL